MISFIIFVLSLLVKAITSFNPVDFVNILGGTNSRYDMSHGGTLPIVARPWGFNHWAPYTNTDTNNAGNFFSYNLLFHLFRHFQAGGFIRKIQRFMV
jgi:putative alpha-1,2-mannosidase